MTPTTDETRKELQALRDEIMMLKGAVGALQDRVVPYVPERCVAETERLNALTANVMTMADNLRWTWRAVILAAAAPIANLIILLTRHN